MVDLTSLREIEKRFCRSKWVKFFILSWGKISKILNDIFQFDPVQPIRMWWWPWLLKFLEDYKLIQNWPVTQTSEPSTRSCNPRTEFQWHPTLNSQQVGLLFLPIAKFTEFQTPGTYFSDAFHLKASLMEAGQPVYTIYKDSNCLDEVFL